MIHCTEVLPPVTTLNINSHWSDVLCPPYFRQSQRTAGVTLLPAVNNHESGLLTKNRLYTSNLEADSRDEINLASQRRCPFPRFALTRRVPSIHERLVLLSSC